MCLAAVLAHLLEAGMRVLSSCASTCPWTGQRGPLFSGSLWDKRS